LIASQWDELLRLTGSLLRGTVTASLLVGRLHAQQRRSTLAAAPQDYGRLVKTEFILGYLTQPPQRRGIHRQLNKGESIDASTAMKAASAFTASTARAPKPPRSRSSPAS
jgi:TnpA family transposase